MKKLIAPLFLILSLSVTAQTNFTATLIRNGAYLSIQLVDDHLIPPFEAGQLWKILKGVNQRKVVKEKELILSCDGLTNQTNDTFGNCSLLFPYSEFQRIGKAMVFKAEGDVAARLNRYFIDSAYLSIERNGVYLSSYNTRRQFTFGINESLIQK